MFCAKNGCGGKLDYTDNYDKLYCPQCGAKYDVNDFVHKMSVSEKQFEENRKYETMGTLKIGLGAPSGFIKDRSKSYVYRIPK